MHVFCFHNYSYAHIPPEEPPFPEGNLAACLYIWV